MSVLRGSLLKRSLLILVLLAVLGFGAIPHYLSGQWSGSTPPKTPGLKQLRNVNEAGLVLSQWDTLEQQSVRLGGREWLQQVVQWNPPEGSANSGSATQPSSNTDAPQEAVLLLRTQKGDRERPQVEWSDLRGERRWREDQVSSLTLNGTKIRWFRAWWETETQQLVTVAVLQWYAWPQGGHWSTNVWFWKDWQRRWTGKTLPWAAISILLPMEPLGDLQTTQAASLAIAESVQEAIAKVYQGDS